MKDQDCKDIFLSSDQKLVLVLGKVFWILSRNKRKQNSYFRLDYYFFIAWGIICLLYGFRKLLSKFINQRKVLHIETTVPHFNTNSHNSEITTLSMMYCAIILTPIFCISAIYVYYISGDDRPKWSEFEYFLTDLTPHIPITIVLPLIIYLQNPRLRRFIVQNMKLYN